METKVKEIANAMKDINLLSSYELSKEKVVAYAEKLNFLFKDLQADHVNLLMNAFFLGKIEYFPTKGIRNFTEHLPNIISQIRLNDFLKSQENE